jgi:hypothetical protein
MSKKFNNMILLYILAGLVILFIIVKWYQNPRTESTLNAELVDIDTNKVSKILIYPSSENRDEIKFYKDGSDWKVTKGKLVSESEQNVVKGMLSTLLEIKVKSLASKDKKKWDEYKVSDTTATRVKVYEGNDLVLDIMIGKFNYQQNRNPYGNMYGGGGGVTGTTFIRLKEDDKVYAVDGFLIFTFNQQFNSFRKQTVAKFERANVEKVSFKYPSDSSFVLEMRDKKWVAGNEQVDSAKVADYLNGMSYKNASSFKDDFINSGMPQYQLIIEGKNMKPITIDGYVTGIESFIVNSNQNPKSWFSTDYKGLFTEIFKPKVTFFANKALKKK